MAFYMSKTLVTQNVSHGEYKYKLTIDETICEGKSPIVRASIAVYDGEVFTGKVYEGEAPIFTRSYLKVAIKRALDSMKANGNKHGIDVKTLLAAIAWKVS